MIDAIVTMFPASLGLAMSFAAVLLGWVYSFRNPQAYPLVNGKRRFEFRAVHAQRRFLSNARGLIQRGLAQVCYHPYKAVHDS